jgi:hypothetical protein
MQPNLGAAKKTGATILGRAPRTNGGVVPAEGATFILNLGIRDDDKKRALELLTKQQKGRITAEELEYQKLPDDTVMTDCIAKPTGFVPAARPINE